MNAQQILEESAQLGILKTEQAARVAAGRPRCMWLDATVSRIEHRLENATAYRDPEEAQGYVDAPWWLWLGLTLGAVGYFGYHAAGWVCR